MAQDGASPPTPSDPATVAAPDTGVTGASGTSSAQADQPATDAAEKLPVATGPKPAKLKLYARKLNGKKVDVGNKLKVVGKMRPFVGQQRVKVKLVRHGHIVKAVDAKVRRVGEKNRGEFSFTTPTLFKPGSYHVNAIHKFNSRQKTARAKLKPFRIDYPDLDPGDSGPLVKLMNRLLDNEGFYTAHGKNYNAATSRAILAFRKVNNMTRNFQATADIFKMLAGHQGGFKLAYPNAGKHVEADLSRQVMVLANHGKAQHIFHISSGAPATPTIKGHFSFYRKEPGTNSHGMVNSVYFIRGYATHGYADVPTYNASHGCLRNPIPDSKFIYNWIDLGDSIYVYN